MTVRRRAQNTRRLARGLLIAAGVGGMATASAQSPTIYSLDVPAEVEHDSNPNMAVGDSRGTTWFRVIPSLKMRTVRGNEEYGLEGALTAEKSSNADVAKDRLDPRVRAAWKHADELNTTELAALLDRRSFRSLDVREQVPLGVDGTRTLFAITGNWRRDLDARTFFTTDLRQDWERFSGTTAPDFRRTTGAFRITRQRDERQNWYAGVNAQAYRSDDTQVPLASRSPGSRSTVYGALVGVDRAFSDAFRVDASVGPVHFARPSSRTDWQGAVTAEYTRERWLAALSVARSPGVNSTFGGLVVTNEARARVRYELSALARLELDAAHARESTARTSRSIASVGWVRQWTPAWQTAVRASMNRQETAAGTAKSNRIALVLSYSAPDL